MVMIVIRYALYFLARDVAIRVLTLQLYLPAQSLELAYYFDY